MTFGETEPSEHRGGEASVPAVVPGKVTFSRRELDRILNLYGRMVAAGGDAIAVVVQAGPKEAPSAMLGAAITALP